MQLFSILLNNTWFQKMRINDIRNHRNGIKTDKIIIGYMKTKIKATGHFIVTL